MHEIFSYIFPIFLLIMLTWAMWLAWLLFNDTKDQIE